MGARQLDVWRNPDGTDGSCLLTGKETNSASFALTLRLPPARYIDLCVYATEVADAVSQYPLIKQLRMIRQVARCIRSIFRTVGVSE